MKTQTYAVGGSQVLVHLLESQEDLPALRSFFRRAAAHQPIALDTETTGKEMFSPSSKFSVRLVQVGDAHEAYVIPVDKFRTQLQAILNYPHYHWVLHNAPFDVLALHTTWMLGDFTSFLSRCDDTYLLSHLLDPRAAYEGGIGLSLKEQAAHYIDPSAPDTQRGLHKEFRSLRRPYLPGEAVPQAASWQSLPQTKLEALLDAKRRQGKRVSVTEGWRWIPIEHPVYWLYAGLDAVYTARLWEHHERAVQARGMWSLYQWERQVQQACVKLQARGMLIDRAYLESLRARWCKRRQAIEAHLAQRYRVQNLHSTQELVAALEADGVVLTERTPTGRPALPAKILEMLAEEGHDLAQLVLEARRIDKRLAAYVDATLQRLDRYDRVHPWIRSLQARTGRMSVAAPPYQQLPAHEWEIRRSVIAPPGWQIISADYQALELRVLAAAARVSRMQQAIKSGEDLHSHTARLLFGPQHTPEQRSLAKMIGLGKVYGGGVDTLAAQSGLPPEQVERVITAYDRLYPEVRRFVPYHSEGDSYVVYTRSGRRLPVSSQHLYRAINYRVQSESRDCLARALLECERRGLDSYLLLPIHDELLGQAPTAQAGDVAREIAEAMYMELDDGVPIEATPSVYGRSWGSGYGCPAEDDAR